MKSETQINLILGIAFIAMTVGITGYVFDNPYPIIACIIVMAILIIYAHLIPYEKEVIGFPEGII